MERLPRFAARFTGAADLSVKASENSGRYAVSPAKSAGTPPTRHLDFSASPLLYLIVASRFRFRSCWIAGDVPGTGHPSIIRSPRHFVLMSAQRCEGGR